MPKRTAHPKKNATQILLVDDHPVLREGIRFRINYEPDLKVCAAVGNFREALDVVGKQALDLVIVDIGLEESHGLDLIRQIHALMPQLPMLVFSMHEEVLYAERALHAGARGYLMKAESPETLVTAIRQVMKGEVYLSATMTRRLLTAFAGKARTRVPMSSSLSDREIEILQMLGEGRSTRQIARTLRISPKTVASHRDNLKKKLGLAETEELLRYAIEFAHKGAPR